jgi:RNA polymerase sigma-70 factor (ECF subfamily)
MTSTGTGALPLALGASAAAPPASPEEVEREAIRRCRRGEREAFGYLVDRYKGPAYGTAYALLGDREEALDAVQEAFVRAWRALPRFDDRFPFPTWFYRILRNFCLDQIRRRKHRRHESLEERREEHGLETPDETRRPDREARLHELRDHLRHAIARLRPVERDVVILKDLQGMTYREIAQTLDIPQGTVASTLFKARRKLQRMLEAEGVRVIGEAS